MKLGIVGSRRRNSLEDKKLIWRQLLLRLPDMIISGGCKRGADRFAEELAEELKIPITIFNPEFHLFPNTRYGKIEAYYARNRKIAEVSDYLIALVAPDRKGGTENTIKYFRQARFYMNLKIL